MAATRNRVGSVPVFPTGRDAHRKCTTCSETYHIYQYPRIDKSDVRGKECLFCIAAAVVDRLAAIRPE